MPPFAHRRAVRCAAALVLALAPAAARAGLFGSKPAPKAATAKSAQAAPASAKDPAARAAAERLDPLARAAFWVREVQADPTDAEAGLKLSSALRALGRYDEASHAADAVLVIQPANVEALLEAARDRIAANQGFYALDFLNRAEAQAPRDWRAPSLLGVAYAQTKRVEEAKAAYRQALALSPDNPAVLSNLALTLATTGSPGEAEALLRRAAAQPGASAQERQNLALVLGMEGKLSEAEGLIRHDLPPDAADANLAYLQALNAPAAPRRP